MALETDKWGTIMQAAQSALFDLGEDSARIEQFVHWALEGARDWHMDMSKTIKTVEKPLNDYFAIDWPPDFVDLSKVGIRKGDTIVTFTRDNLIPLIWDYVDGNRIANEDHRKLFGDLDAVNTYMVPFWGFDQPIFGLAYKDNGVGYFRVNIDRRQIQFRTDFPRGTKVLLEYISDGWDPKKTTLINPKAFKLIKEYIHWQNLRFKPNRPLSEVQYAEDQYWKEFDRVSWRMFDLSIEDVLEIQREALVATIQQ